MTVHVRMRQGLLVTVAFGLLLAASAFAEEKSAEPKKEEVPFWAIGKPTAGPGATMAPVPALPIPTAADKLPVRSSSFRRASRSRSIQPAFSTRAACAKATRAPCS